MSCPARPLYLFLIGVLYLLLAGTRTANAKSPLDECINDLKNSVQLSRFVSARKLGLKIAKSEYQDACKRFQQGTMPRDVAVAAVEVTYFRKILCDGYGLSPRVDKGIENQIENEGALPALRELKRPYTEFCHRTSGALQNPNFPFIPTAEWLRKEEFCSYTHGLTNAMYAMKLITEESLVTKYTNEIDALCPKFREGKINYSDAYYQVNELYYTFIQRIKISTTDSIFERIKHFLFSTVPGFFIAALGVIATAIGIFTGLKKLSEK